MSFFDQVTRMADNAPEAGFTNVSFGQLFTKPLVMKWADTNEIGTDGKAKRKPVYNPYPEGYIIDTEHGESLALEFTVNIRELNPALEFDFVRTIEVRKSSQDGRNKTDWTEIVEPSLKALFGSDWGARLALNPYVKIEQPPQVGTKPGAAKVYSTIKFVEVFESKEACVEAHTLQFAKRDSVTGETVVSPASGSNIPLEKIEQVRGLILSVGAAKAEEILQGKPFGDFDPAELMKLAQNGAA